jgi:hypothetical protein
MVNEEILSFCIENRLRVVILLGRADDTKFEDFPEKIVQTAVKLVYEHFASAKPEIKSPAVVYFNLEQIYRNGIKAMVEILTRFENEDGIRNALDGFSKYHLAGLKGFFE